MTLYAYWRSSSAWRVRIALQLKGVEHRIASVNLLKAEHRSAAHLARSPLGQIPVLELDDGTCLTQSLAICQYLDHVAPTPRLIPQEPLAAARVWAMAEVINSGTQPLQNMSVLKKVEALGADRVAWGQDVIGDGLRALQTLSAPHQGRFLFGDEVTLADVCLVPQLYNARRFKLDLSELQPLVDIDARCAELPAFQKAHPSVQPDAVA